MINQRKICDYICKMRKEAGLTQKDLANQLGISFQAVSKWETGETLPDTGLLLDLASILHTTTDKILSGGTLVHYKAKRVEMADIKKGFDILVNLRSLFGERNTFYRGAIEGINKRMNIDFEALVKDEKQREFLLGDIILQFLMEGYTIDHDEVLSTIKNPDLLKIIAAYMGEDVRFDTLTYDTNKALFDQIRSIKPAFKDLKELTRLPGEYIYQTPNKDYWCTQIEIDQKSCYGIAVDEQSIKVFTYGYGGENQTLIHEEKRRD